KRETSQDGYELRFAVNYLAGFLLTRELLPLIAASKLARIVNVSSLGQQPIEFDDVMLTHGYSGGPAHAPSQIAPIMFTFDLARELDPAAVTANCLHPATYMATTMVRQSGVTPISSVEQGAEAILHLAQGKELDGHSGAFYNGLVPARAHAQAYDEAARARLGALSMELTGRAGCLRAPSLSMSFRWCAGACRRRRNMPGRCSRRRPASTSCSNTKITPRSAPSRCAAE